MHIGRWILAVLLLLSAPAIAAAQPAPPLPANVVVVASGLLNPRGFTWGPDGNMYVAEAGSPPAGFPLPQIPPDPAVRGVANSSGRISRIDAAGTRTTIADGLPVLVNATGDTIGPASVAFVDSRLYAIISAGPAHGHPEFPGGVYEIGMDGSVTLVANTDSFNVANPPASCGHCGSAADELSNPYDMVALNGKLYISDGNKDVINVVDPAAPESSRITRLADLSSGGHKVLTGLAIGPDANLYVVNLTPAPFRAGAGMVRQVSLDGLVEELGAGLTAASGVAVAPDGSRYVAEIGTSIAQPPFLIPPGRIVMPTTDQAVQVISAPLMFPTILRWGHDGLYATNFGVAGNAGNGAILRITP